MLTKRELFNARNAGLKISEGLKITLTGVGTFEDIDKDGKTVTVSALKSEDGAIYTTISATIAQSLDDLEDIIAEEGKVTVIVNQNTSNSGREFYQLQIL